MLSSRIFGTTDQVRFAELTGDFNPMHMDPLAARRTQAGSVVVHGIHSLLWLLDVAIAHHSDLPTIATLKVRFTRMIYLGDVAEARITRLDSSSLRAEISVDGVAAVQLAAKFGPVRPAPTASTPENARSLRPDLPLEPTWEDIEGNAGYLAFASSPSETERMFPNAVRHLGNRRIAALGCSTFLIGMVIPGLHSIYTGLTIDVCEDHDPSDRIAFQVSATDFRFRSVELAIQGGGLSGSLECFARQPPTGQASLEVVAKQVSPTEFAGATALIVGGSRGLGELTAKAIAAGGGIALITYAVGKGEADRVVSEITVRGGKATAAHFDVTRDAATQFAAMGTIPTHIYYFATPPIFRGKSGVFSQARFDEFNTFYVKGFYDVVKAGLTCRPEGVKVFYPSSVAVSDRPANMTEYAMSKAAGEILCADINANMRKVQVIVARLPRLPTDQTASIVQVKTDDPLTIMLPIIREVQRV